MGQTEVSCEGAGEEEEEAWESRQNGGETER